jgi:hypothetical protein
MMAIIVQEQQELTGKGDLIFSSLTMWTIFLNYEVSERNVCDYFIWNKELKGILYSLTHFTWIGHVSVSMIGDGSHNSLTIWDENFSKTIDTLHYFPLPVYLCFSLVFNAAHGSWNWDLFIYSVSGNQTLAVFHCLILNQSVPLPRPPLP